jgi:uncharacterized protein DUF4249
VVRRVRPPVLGLLLLAAAGCKLMDVVVAPPGDPVVVVQAVLNAAQQQQLVSVARSRTGDTTTGISGAAVQLTDLDPRSCPTPTVQLAELPFPAPGVSKGGIYQTSDLCPLRPGDRVTLRVETPDGHIVTGSTRVPGVRGISVRAGGTTAQFPPASLVMDRTRDSVFVTVDLVFARALQVEAVRTDVGEDPSYSLSTDTTGVSVPGDLVDLFQDAGRTIFRAGAYYQLTAAALDTNYFDFVRSGTNPLTGRGFLNHLSGAIGVFGSVSPFTYELRVTAPQRDPREGVYRISGGLAGVAVDVTWDVYRDIQKSQGQDEGQGDGFSAFVDGAWVDGPVRTSANGSFRGTTFMGEMFGPTSRPNTKPAYVLSGTRPQQGTPFAMEVSVTSDPLTTYTLTAVQVSGPR